MSGVFNMESQRGQGDGGVDQGYRSLGNGHNSRPQSPLKFFALAKKSINDIFKDLSEYILEANTFLEDNMKLEEKEGEKNKTSVKEYHNMVRGIIEVLTRDHMKVAFFGRTSNGKSTVINAMLRNKILPSGIGHTTNCFIQVEGSDTNEGYLLTEESDQPKSIMSLRELGSALSTVKLKENSLIRIMWPKEKCRLLREDVVIVDSPGVDVSPNLDVWIDKFCLDADVFVLVANAESTLMQTEKNFFHKVSDRLSKPNIFILQNRWDVSVHEDDAEEVKEQHYQRNVDFLSDELKVADRQEAKDRIFFVSAKEALISRLSEDNKTPTPSGTLQKDYHERLFSFANFERTFEVCISKSAVKTKFEQHAERGQKITASVRKIMDGTYNYSLEQMKDKQNLQCDKAHELDYLEKQLLLLTTEIKDKIKNMVEEVENKVARALNEEIRRLSIVVDDFDKSFNVDPLILKKYKEKLHVHVEKELGRNLQLRCSKVLHNGVETTEKEMIERLGALLPESDKIQLFSMVPKREFEIAYRIDCHNLCKEFQEDIQFRFSLGITALMQRFLGTKGTRSVLMGYSDSIPRPVPGAPQTPSEESYYPPAQNEMLLSLLSGFITMTSRATVAGLLVTGLVLKAAGWRVIVVTGGLYGMCYLYQRLTWTTKAKERAFKQQYVEYAGSKLKLIVDLTSSNCSHQVQQELSSTYARLCNQVDITKQRLEQEIHELNKELSQLKENSTKAKSLRNKADWIDSQLKKFVDDYLLKPSAS
ncbi:hypothetical protein KUTeg_001388 [Tegillarca granosa]|uniref:Dynamin-type G domain-containing protein n=1 Tax=Tegillarca granosa TaxID=220873 RepID=A0ABQ9FSS2_TEGGR|nr:hypothetical protein KUTeg_001388 [Tegillarca granosa]